ncbi:hypothetical protein LCGC14_2203060, partial [marine sediment metagenome]
MALPITIDTSAGRKGHHPPFKSSGGNFYAVVNSSFAGELQAKKATDPADSWTEQDAAGNPTVNFTGFSAVQGSDVIHIVSWTALGTYTYHQFNMATDNWDVVDEEIDAPADDPTFPWASIAVRSDGDVVVVYAGDTDAVMGSKKERVDYNVRTGTTWGGPVSLDTAGDVHFGNPNVVKGPLTDDMHILWQATADTADPPVSWEALEARTLDPSNVLSTLNVGVGATTTGNMLGYGSNPVSYDDAGTQRIILAGTGAALKRIILSTEDASDDIVLDTVIGDLQDPDPGPNGEVGIMTLVELDGDLHMLYRGDTDLDIYYTTSTDDGNNWAVPVEEIDAITVNFISANIYVRGADTVMAYVYDSFGVQVYNEKVLIPGDTGAITATAALAFTAT